MDSSQILLNVAATQMGTEALGPGFRAVVWVQGCPIHCPGCIAPDWIPFKPARLISPAVLLEELLANPRITGLTFSGGEPMAQAVALAQLARLARQRRELDIICFSGFTLEKLQASPPFPGIADLLSVIDVLVDGPYIARLNNNLGLRGSSNQRIHYLTPRLAGIDLSAVPRTAEILIQDGQVMLVGVPPLGVRAALEAKLFQERKS